MKTTPKKDMMSDATNGKSQPKEYILNTTMVVISFISSLFDFILCVL